jgi:hypothetical protein
MFAFWIGTIGVLSGIMFGLLNAYLKWRQFIISNC